LAEAEQLATVLVFDDYRMGNYAELVLMAFMYRTMWLRNQDDTLASG